MTWKQLNEKNTKVLESTSPIKLMYILSCLVHTSVKRLKTMHVLVPC